MTLEEIRQLKVGDIVWMLCLDEEPGQAVKCEVTKPANDYDVVTIKCVGRPDCKGHYPWHGDISKTEVEVYEKAISRAESSIESSESSIQYEQDNIAQKKADIQNLKAKLEEAKGKLVWITNCGEVQQVSSKDADYANFIKYATEQEAYEALAKYYERKLFKTLEKCGYKFAIPWDDKWIIPMLVRGEEEEVWRVIYYPSQSYGCVRKQDLFDTLDEAEAELKRRKK